MGAKMKTVTRMYHGIHLWLFPLIIVSLRFPHKAFSCPQPCACYVSSEVHCTFRSLVKVPTRIPKLVERINLGFNSIQSIPEHAFSGLSKLEMLLTHSNDIQNIPNGAFKDLSSLQVFKMSYNKLKVITSHTFHGLSSLTRLHVDHNKVEYIHPNAFSGLTALRLLHLEGNSLRQLHANTFCTFNFLGYFRQSTLKHLYLSDNLIQTLPAGMIQTMPLLENIYLHGNPWTCDCQLNWLLEWDKQSNGVLKCKKDKSYENGQLCAMCSSPRHLQNQEIQSLKDMSCSRPIISSPLRTNSSDMNSEDDDTDPQLNKDFLGQIILNMTDEHGNKVNLDCHMKKSEDYSKIQWNQLHQEEIDVNATFALDFECSMTRENYEKLWKLIAYYSEVPVQLERELLFTDSSKETYRYKQNLDHDSYYYTGVRAVITAEPEWVMQPVIKIQLNRKMSTAKKVTLSFSTQLSQSIHTKDIQYPKSNWVMINKDENTKTSYSVIKGSVLQMTCQVKSSEMHTIEWSFPDGTKLKAPYNNEDGRYSISANGQLTIEQSDFQDAGVYHCIAQVKHEVDTLAVRVVVQPSSNEVSESNIKVVTKTIGESVTLPCSAEANPNAEVNWILPNSNILNSSTNKTGVYLLNDGSLLIPIPKLTDSGLYRCIALNQYGEDHYSVQVAILRKYSEQLNRVTIIKKRPLVKVSSKPKYDVVDDDRGSGERDLQEETDKHNVQDRITSGKDKSFRGQGKNNRKDRKKNTSWKKTEKDEDSNIAEGRRKFESRRRIIGGNKKIDPKKWATILAKVRGRNILKTTDVPLLTTPRVVTLPSYKHEDTTPSLISEPLYKITEVASSIEEASADDDVLHMTSSPKVTITQYQDLTTQVDDNILVVTKEEADDYSEIPFIEEIQEAETTDSSFLFNTLNATNSVMSTIENLDIEDSIYSTGDEDFKASTEDDTDIESVNPTTDIETETDQTDYIPEQQENLTDEDPTLTPIETITTIPNTETDDTEDDGIAALPSFDTTQHATVEVSTYKYPATPEIYNNGDNANLHVNTGISSTSPTEYIPEDKQIVLKVIDDMITKSTEFTSTSSLSPETSTGFAVMISVPVVTESLVKGSFEDIYSEKYMHTREEVFTKSDIIHLSGENGPETSREADHHLWITTSPHTFVTIPKTTTTTMPISTQSPTTTPFPTNAYLQYPKRRKNGRRKFRPNRFRHRQDHINPTVSPVQSYLNLVTQKIPISEEEKIIRVLSNQDNIVHQPRVTTQPTHIQSTYRAVFPSLEKHKQTTFIAPTAEVLHTTKAPSTLVEVPLGPPVTVAETETEEVYTLKSIDDAVDLQKNNIQTMGVLNTQRTTTESPKTNPNQNWKLPKDKADISEDTEIELTEYRPGLVRQSPSVLFTEEPPTLATHSTTTYSPIKYATYTQKDAYKQSTTVHQTTQKNTIAITEDKNNQRTIHNFHLNKATDNHPYKQNVTLNPSKYVTAHPVTKTIFISTPHVYLTSPGTQHLPIQPSVPKTKYQEVLNPVATTQGTKLLQKSTLSSRINELDIYSSNQNKVYIQSKQEQIKDTYSSKLNNSLPYNPKYRHQPRIVNNYHHGIVPPYHNPVRGNVRPPHIGTHGPLRYYVTNQPIAITNKPEITAYTAHTVQNIQEKKVYTPHVPTTIPTTTTTTVIPLYRPRPATPNKFTHGQRITPHYRPYGNNFITDNKGSSIRIPNNVNPYYINPRIPYRFNRTRLFQFTVTSKPIPPTILAPASPKNKVWTTASTSSAVKTTTSLAQLVTQTFTTTTSTTTPAHFVQSRTTQASSNIHPLWHYFNLNQRPHLTTNKVESTREPPLINKYQESKPKIVTTGYQFVSLPFGMDAVLPCETTGEPKPSITWTKLATGAIISSKNKIQRFEVLENGTLHIQNLQLQDRGQYMCTAQNKHGIDKMTITLSVVAQQPKIILLRSNDILVYLGDTVTMDCNASGVPPPHISWVLPDRRILRTVSTTESHIMLFANGSLSIKDVTFPDRGIYKCVAGNVAGADSLTMKLQVSPLPPLILQEKVENISLPQSHSIYIHCSAKGAPPPTIRWVVFDGTQVRPSQYANGNLFVFPNGTLYIRNSSPRDIGKYECIAANIVGAARRTVHLDVRKYPSNAKITASSPQKTDVSYGGTLRLDCSAAGDPWPRIMWRLPSKRLVDSFFSFDSRIKTFSNGTLIIYSVTEKDAGDYLCMARNKLGDDYLVLKVNVMMKPAKIQHKNDVDHKVIYGGDLKVDCIATGVPNPDISWSLPDGSMVNNVMQSDDSGTRSRRYVVFNNGTLYFNDVGMKEEGDYTCYAVNQIGQDEMRVSVKIVAERAVIKNKTYSIINVPYGDVVTISCEAKGEPVPKITWLSSANRPIPTSSEKYQIFHDGTLLIQKAQRSDSGNYTCLAQNKGGEDKKVVHIQVNVLPPKINGYSNTIMTIKESAMKDTRLLIDCKAEGVPTPRVMWAFPEGVILPAPYYGNRIAVHRNGTLEIKALRKTDSVQLVCIGRNEGGEAKLIVQLTVTEPAVKPHFNYENENVVVAEGQSAKLNCSAIGMPQPDLIWILPNGTQINNGNHLHGIFHRQDGTLHIGSIAASDGGTYRCRAVNIAGSADRMVTLQVGRKPQISNNNNNLVSIINGETLQLHCIAQGELRPHISWTLPNGMVIDGPKDEGRISLLQNGSLVVRDTTVYDRGSYQCKAKTQYGSSTINVPVIVIAYPPRITTSPASVIYARPGSSVQLNCMSIGIPKAEITWELPDKSHLTAGAQSRLYGNKFLHPQGTLVIQHSSKRDAGYYKCTAKNILGSDTKTTYIHVY
ncbi:matrix-remodeling-associated protein 5 isoform X1 [Bufo gargarizans]|uniref:matrix-remodeling-associated protein 5 isoform X1 n=2 Tax=Bufo gargarizans TaxID=30331 RepID=UPI001CF2D90F|nr:matrix-remodeling-associated protein 5 isoform X1 [Bufo gargarizans]